MAKRMNKVKCKYCKNYKNEWCEIIFDSPYPDIERDCRYFHEGEGCLIERMLNDMFSLATSVAGGYEKITGAYFNAGGKLVIQTEDETDQYEWTIGEPEDEEGRE